MHITRYYLIILFTMPQLMAQNFPANFNDDMQKQFFELTKEQKESIASQYGIDLDDQTQEESGQSYMQSDIDERFQNYQQQDFEKRPLDMLSNSYQKDTLITQKPLLDQSECFDQEGNPLTIQSQYREKLDKKDQNECYDSFGNLLDFQDSLEDADNLAGEELTRFGLSFFNI